MKYYMRQIKPYIRPFTAPGSLCVSCAVEGYDWVTEDMEEELREKIVIEDKWYTLVFKERFVEVEVDLDGQI